MRHSGPNHQLFVLGRSRWAVSADAEDRLHVRQMHPEELGIVAEQVCPTGRYIPRIPIDMRSGDDMNLQLEHGLEIFVLAS